MAFAGGLGATIFLNSVPLRDTIVRNDYVLFSESNSRFIVEIAPKDQAEFEKLKAKGYKVVHFAPAQGQTTLAEYDTRVQKKGSSRIAALPVPVATWARAEEPIRVSAAANSQAMRFMCVYLEWSIRRVS